MKSVKDSCSDGRDSWLVNSVFGKMDDEVVAAKSRRQAAEVLPESDMVRWCSSDCLCKGLGQQALRHNSVTFFKQGDCISLSLSRSTIMMKCVLFLWFLFVVLNKSSANGLYL